MNSHLCVLVMVLSVFHLLPDMIFECSYLNIPILTSLLQKYSHWFTHLTLVMWKIHFPPSCSAAASVSVFVFLELLKNSTVIQHMFVPVVFSVTTLGKYGLSINGKHWHSYYITKISVSHPKQATFRKILNRICVLKHWLKNWNPPVDLRAVSWQYYIFILWKEGHIKLSPFSDATLSGMFWVYH